MVPVLTKDDSWSRQFKNLGEFFKYVTELKTIRAARRAFQKWLESMKLGDTEKRIEGFKRSFVDAAGALLFLKGMKRMFSDWNGRNRGTAGTNNAAFRKPYRFVREVTGLKAKDKDNKMEKALIVEWKKHEATTGHQTGEGAALLERLRERFPPWWKEKQAGNANGKDAPKSSRRSASKKS